MIKSTSQTRFGQAAILKNIKKSTSLFVVSVVLPDLQYTIQFSHLAGKDLQCDYLGKCDYIGTGAEQHFNPPWRLQTVKFRQRHAQAEKNGGLLIAQFEQRLLLHPPPSKTSQIAQETGEKPQYFDSPARISSAPEQRPWPRARSWVPHAR